jgi:hypothetical protein
MLRSSYAQGGLVAGLELGGDDLIEAAVYATVASSFVIEQWVRASPVEQRAASDHAQGLPSLDADGQWNGDRPNRRLEELRRRHAHLYPSKAETVH